MEEIILYGRMYEIKCKKDCYSIVNDGGTETVPCYCPYCGELLDESAVKEVIVVGGM